MDDHHFAPITINLDRKVGSQSGFLSISCLSYNKGSNWLTICPYYNKFGQESRAASPAFFPKPVNAPWA